MKPQIVLNFEKEADAPENVGRAEQETASATCPPSPDLGSQNPGLTTHRSALALDRGGTFRKVSAGSRRFCDKPSSAPPACWRRLPVCACAKGKGAGESSERSLRSLTTTLEPQISRESSLKLLQLASPTNQLVSCPHFTPNLFTILIKARKVPTTLQPTTGLQSTATTLT